MISSFFIIQDLTRDDACARINFILLIIAYYSLPLIGCVFKLIRKVTGYVRKRIRKIEGLIKNWINSIEDAIEDREGENRLQQFFRDFCMLLALYGLVTIGCVFNLIRKITEFAHKWIRKIERLINNCINSIEVLIDWERENRFHQFRV